MDTYRVARLPARLRGFALSDTSTQPGGYVEAGDDLVLEEKFRHPTPDTDYARLLVPQLGALDTWVCTRWRTHCYATLVSQARAPAMARLPFDSEPLTVSEERLTIILSRTSPCHCSSIPRGPRRARHSLALKRSGTSSAGRVPTGGGGSTGLGLSEQAEHITANPRTTAWKDGDSIAMAPDSYRETRSGSDAVSGTGNQHHGSFQK